MELFCNSLSFQSQEWLLTSYNLNQKLQYASGGLRPSPVIRTLRWLNAAVELVDLMQNLQRKKRTVDVSPACLLPSLTR